jgi:hypothetical protein
MVSPVPERWRNVPRKGAFYSGEGTKNQELTDNGGPQILVGHFPHHPKTVAGD